MHAHVYGCMCVCMCVQVHKTVSVYACVCVLMHVCVCTRVMGQVNTVDRLRGWRSFRVASGSRERSSGDCRTQLCSAFCQEQSGSGVSLTADPSLSLINPTRKGRESVILSSPQTLPSGTLDDQTPTRQTRDCLILVPWLGWLLAIQVGPAGRRLALNLPNSPAGGFPQDSGLM